jgi:hypothetical protein
LGEVLAMSLEEVNKMIEVKTMDLEECEHELNSRYYPSIVRIAMMNYITLLQQQIEKYSVELELIKGENLN